MSRQIERRISFNGGEVSPWIEPRIDLEKYRSSARRMENFRPAIYGGAFTRAGSVFVAEQPDKANAARLAAFEFSATTAMMMVFTDLEFTVYTTGDLPTVPVMTSESVDSLWNTEVIYQRGHWVEAEAWTGVPGIYYCEESHTSTDLAFDTAAGRWTLTTAFKRATPYLAAQLPELQFQQINDVIYVTHPSHAPRIFSRLANNQWSIEMLVQEWPALRTENISPVSLTPSATTGTGITVTASAATFQPGHVGSRWLIKHRREDPFISYAFALEAVGDTSESLFVLGDWSLTVVSGSGTGNWECVVVVERSVTGGGDWETIRSMPASRSDRSGIITGTELDPCYLRLRVASKVGSIPANSKYTLEAVDPDHYGIFDVTAYASETSVTADVVFTLGEASLTRYWAEPAWSDYRGWPRSVCIHEQRLMFGGNASQPQTVWGSIIDDFYNFRVGADDDMGLALTFAGQKANAIQWMVSQGSLIVGTSGAEGPVGARDAEKTLTPANARTGKFTSTGSAFIQAIPVQDTVIFIQRNGRKAWEFSFVFESDGYKAQDLTLLAEHITDGQILQVALQRYPEPVLWCIDSGGQLLGLAYDRNQGIAGWFRYTTDGAYESVAVVSGSGEEDQVWVTVRRGGSRFIERFQPDRVRLLKDDRQELLCCADAAVIHDGRVTAGTFTVARMVADVDPEAGWEAGRVQRLTFSAASFPAAAAGDEIQVTVNGVTRRWTIVAADGDGTLDARAHAGVPLAMRGVPLGPWLRYFAGVGGFAHLEGRTVCVVADGAPVPSRTVTGGRITLDGPALVVIAGLPFTCYLQPSYLETNDPNALSKVAWKNIHRVDLELWRSLGCAVSANEGESWERVEFLAQGDRMDGPLPLYSGYKQVLCDSRSERKTSPMIRQDQPLPLNVLSLHVWHEMNEG